MPRSRTLTPDIVVERAMLCFWRQGFGAISVDELVREIGVSRHSLYCDFDGKHGLFLACLAQYARNIVTPAFMQVEAPGAGFDAVRGFFESQIARGEAAGVLGLGCLMANTMTELAPHDAAASRAVAAHNERLRTGFQNTLSHAAQAPRESARVIAMANMLVVFTNGLWSFARTNATPATLRAGVAAMLHLIGKELDPCLSTRK